MEAEVWRRQDARLILRVLGGGDEALGDKVLVVETDEVEVAELLVVAPPGAQFLRLAPDVRRALERLLAAVHDEHLGAVVLHARREQQRREHLRDVLGTAEARDHHAHADAEPGADVHRRLRVHHRQEGEEEALMANAVCQREAACFGLDVEVELEAPFARHPGARPASGAPSELFRVFILTISPRFNTAPLLARTAGTRSRASAIARRHHLDLRQHLVDRLFHRRVVVVERERGAPTLDAEGHADASSVGDVGVAAALPRRAAARGSARPPAAPTPGGGRARRGRRSGGGGRARARRRRGRRRRRPGRAAARPRAPRTGAERRAAGPPSFASHLLLGILRQREAASFGWITVIRRDATARRLGGAAWLLGLDLGAGARAASRPIRRSGGPTWGRRGVSSR